MKADIIIIGGGPGGYETALSAAKEGKKVILFNGGELGGTCLNEGCIPTKCLCRDAGIIGLLRDDKELGMVNLQFDVDYNKILDRKEKVVETLREGVKTLLAQAKVEVINAKARFKDNHTVTANGEEYTADNIIIATGSETRTLPIPGHDKDCVMDSKKMLDLEYVPARLTIIGGGVIGMEFASIFSQLGSKVTVLEYMKHILPPFDTDVSKRLKQALSKKGVNIVTGAEVKEIRQNEFYEIEAIYELKGKRESVISSDLLMAVGRKPRIADLGLENTDIEYSERGIKTDDYMRTSVPGVYAIGDVNAKMMLAHVAIKQGERALAAINDRADKINFELVPSAAFTVPECGMAGKTEEQCKAEGTEIMTGMGYYRANGKALAMNEPEGFCKLIFRKEDRKLIGAHIMGAEAADLAQQCCDMMNSGVTVEGMKEIIFGHPTLSEVIQSAVNNVK